MESASRYVAPRTGVEEILADIWKEVLKVERVGVEDNFFELGGHSLLAMQVMSRIRRVFGVDTPLAALLERATIRGLAEAITKAEVHANSSAGFIRNISQREEEKLLQLDNLSEQELDALIEQLSASNEQPKSVGI